MHWLAKRVNEGEERGTGGTGGNAEVSDEDIGVCLDLRHRTCRATGLRKDGREDFGDSPYRRS